MKILVLNRAFKVLELEGAFSCALALAGVFAGVRAFADNAMTGPNEGNVITASQAAAGSADDMKNKKGALLCAPLSFFLLVYFYFL